MLKEIRSSWARLDATDVIILMIGAVFVTAGLVSIVNFFFHSVSFGRGLDISLFVFVTVVIGLGLCTMHGMRDDGNPI